MVASTGAFTAVFSSWISSVQILSQPIRGFTAQEFGDITRIAGASTVCRWEAGDLEKWRARISTSAVICCALADEDRRNGDACAYLEQLFSIDAFSWVLKPPETGATFIVLQQKKTPSNSISLSRCWADYVRASPNRLWFNRDWSCLQPEWKIEVANCKILL
jgi:hypothetical protein